ncbi:MAG TPA: polyphosphate kinase 2 family protein [Actinomycetota bacterium]|nr:polyphosphate kinase 2 family protein [Actinomycetota bacterium]
MRAPVSDLLRLPDGAVATQVDPRGTPGAEDRATAEAQLAEVAGRLEDLQQRLRAEGTRSLLLVLQGMDTSGKGGTVRHVMSAMNPAWVDVTAFGPPTEEELAHHFLWRIGRRLPGPGHIGVFDRSHYEDVLIVRVRELVPEHVWRPRYDEIAAWEGGLVTTGTTIVKCLLHISPGEQRARLLARLDDPTKHWKFDEADIEERARWAEYMAAYDEAIARTSTEDAPWYVVPADRKWHRNWAIAHILAETLEAMDPRYPPSDLDVPALRARLGPPN